MIDIYKAIFRHANDPQFVLDLKTQKYIVVNPAFCNFLGYKEEEVANRLTPVDISLPEDLPILKKLVARRKQGVTSERYPYRVVCKSGEIKHIEVSVRRVTVPPTKMHSNRLVVGSWRDKTDFMVLEKSLRDKLQEVALANTRVLALTEKIKNVPVLTASLLKTNKEERLIKNACTAMCDRRGLGLDGVDAYLVRGNYLERCYPPGPNGRRKIDIRKSPQFARLLFTEYETDYGTPNEPDTSSGKIAIPLKGRNQPLGILHLKLNRKERELMESNPTAKKGYYEVLRTLANSIGLAIENLRLTEALTAQSIRDGLTNIFNRRHFNNMLADEFKRAKRYRRKLSLLFLDLNDFKQINDKHGHQQGDIILREVAQLVNANSRKIDIVCRYGGDEFAIIMPETGLDGARAKADKLQSAVETTRFTNLADPALPFRVTISAGVSTIASETNTSDELISVADNNLFAHKKGR